MNNLEICADRKEQYTLFCNRNYVPIYSKPWWMDAVCGPNNWDVWLYEEGGTIAAAMPFYFEWREHGLYITKAPLTQNNGIIFSEDSRMKPVARSKFEERVISEAVSFLDGRGLAVYEQQYQTSFTNWLPFYWNGCNAIPRYTYTIDRNLSMEQIKDNVSSKQRSIIRKGKKAIDKIEMLGSELFYQYHENVFKKQGLECPFSLEFFERLVTACSERQSCAALCAKTEGDNVASLIFLVWDEHRMYQILGGNMPAYQRLDTYSALIWHAIQKANGMGLTYDFEGSMIKRISKSFREFGGSPEQYFRIRKIYSKDVVMMEAENSIRTLTERDAQS